jgi:hypothetical protein
LIPTVLRYRWRGYRFSSRVSHDLAKSQSRLTVRGEIFKTSTISSSLIATMAATATLAWSGDAEQQTTSKVEGAHITVLYNRLAWSLTKPGLAPALLGHVLVHEITHILEGVTQYLPKSLATASHAGGFQ